MSVGSTNASCYTTGSGPADADLYGCMVNDAGSAFGGPEIFGLFVGAAVMLALYIASDFSPEAPTIGTILLGSMLIPALPAQYSSIGLTMMIMGAVIGIFVAAQRYVLEVGT